MRGLGLVTWLGVVISSGVGFSIGTADAAERAAAKQLDRIFARMRSDPQLQRNHAACPADIFGTVSPFWEGTVDWSWPDEAFCREQPGECLSACMQGRNMDSCFSLARVVQDDAPEELGDYAQMLFAQACASSSPDGCTNRGAGIRNGSYPHDPFSDWGNDKVEACLLRTFEASCRADSPWGCTMAGQAHHNGEGTAANRELARHNYVRACSLSPDFSSCDMARERIEELD